MNITINRFKLAPYQEAFLYNPERFTGVEATTKGGKTAGLIQWAVEQWHDFSVPVGWETTWCAPVYEQAKIAFKRIKRTLPRQYDVNESSLTLYTPRGDELRFKSAEKVDHLYGPDARAVVFEEFTRARNLNEAFMALRSTLTATKGKMKLIGNFIGNANAGHQLILAHKNDPEWASFIVNAQMAVEAGILDAGEVEQARKDLPRADFMALYMCEGSSHPLQLIPSDAIADLWTNQAQRGEKYMIVDVARFGRDRTIVGVWDGLQLIDGVDYTKQDLVTTAAAIDNLARAHRVGRSHIAVDEGGVGGGLVDMLKGCVSFNGAASPVEVTGKKENFANLRAQCYYMLADYCIDRMIGISDELSHERDTIALELEVVRRLDDQVEGKHKVIKKDEMKELIGRSPDWGDMLMMRMYFELAADYRTFEKSIAIQEQRFREERYENFKRDLAGNFGLD